MRSLVAAIDALATVDPTDAPGSVALARLRVLLAQKSRLDALVLQALADADVRALHTVDDASSLPAWVDSLQVPGVDGGQVTLARRLRRAPQIRTELAAGRMSSRTATLITRAVAKARPFLDQGDGLIDGQPGEPALQAVVVDGVADQIAEQLGRAADAPARLASLRAELTERYHDGRTQIARWEAALIVLARDSDPALLGSAIGMLVDALLPDEHRKRAERAEQDRGLDLHRNSLGSGWYVKGELDDETGELLATVLDAATVTDPDRPDDTRRHADGTRAAGDDVDPADWPFAQPRPRSRRQQRHDALRLGLRRLLDSGALGLRGKTAPHIAVTVPLGFLESQPGALPARTDHGLRLSRDTVQRLAGTGLFTRLVLDAQHRVIEMSHTQRTSTAAERLILKVEGGCVCSGAGCARGPATGHRLIPHHGGLFSKTGLTELADSILLCELEHDHHLHDQRRTIRLKDGRILGPDGWVRR